MEASAIPASVGLARTRIAIGASLLRIRTDEQLVTLFREGNDEAFRVIHDRYRARMFTYTRQMLGSSGQDPEDAVQEIFMRAFHGLRASHRELALRAWLYRIAHNRCIDDLRRSKPMVTGLTETSASAAQDPLVRVEQRDALRRLISDMRRLPDQQRSALLLRELSGMSYAEVSGALGVSVPAVKSLLVRARVGLAQASEARNTACAEIRADLILAHDRGVRSSGMARRHLRECQGCREFRTEIRGVSRQLAALAPTLGPIGLIANLLGWGGGSGGAAAGGGAMAGSGGAAAGGSAAAAGGVATGAGVLAVGASHVVTLLAAAVVTAGGAVEIQHTLSNVVAHRAPHHQLVAPAPGGDGSANGRVTLDRTGSSPANTAVFPDGSGGGAFRAARMTGPAGSGSTAAAGSNGSRTPITEIMDPDMYTPNPPPSTLPPTATSGAASPSATSGGSASTPGTTSGQTGATTGTTGSTSGSTGSGTPSASGTGTGGDGSKAASGTSSTPPATTGTSGSSGTGATPSATNSTRKGSVGQSTSSAGSGALVSLIGKRRHSRRRHLLDRLLVR